MLINFTGSPLIPPLFTVIIISTSITIAAITYWLLHRHHKPQTHTHRFSLLLSSGIISKFILLLFLTASLSYTLFPAPQLTHSTPNLHPQAPLTFTFNHPLNRQDLKPTIEPNHPGYWVFQKPLYATHLNRQLSFIPTQTFPPNTTYTLTLKNIKNFAQLSKPYTHTQTYTTPPLPQITTTTPTNTSTQVSPTSPITIQLDQPNQNTLQIDYQITPDADFHLTSDPQNLTYYLTPQTPLHQDQTYTLEIFTTPIIHNLANQTIASRLKTSTHTLTFTTKPPPGITNTTPQGKHHPTNTPITITFDQPINRQSAQTNFSIDPPTTGTFSWDQNSTQLTFTPQALTPDTTYTLTLTESVRTQSGGRLNQTHTHSFSTIAPVRIARLYPTHGWQSVGTNTPITITFDQPINPDSVQNRITVTPHLDYQTQLNDTTLTLTPQSPLDYNTTYTITITPGISGPIGLTSTDTYTSSFTTQDQIVKLPIPTHLQQYSLSCEVAALKMALNYRGTQVTEDQLLDILGFDPTPKRGNTWGNPYLAFVGRINGRQMYDGYGVYWPPIARVASQFHPASHFQNWTIQDLTYQISHQNPIVIWVYSSSGRPTHWYTPNGTKIPAASGEHAVTVAGFVGPADNPSQIIINDPLIGQVYWPRSLFDHKWSTFQNSGVVIYN